MDIIKFAKATIDYFKYLSEYPTDYTREKKFVSLVQNNNAVMEVLLQKMWQPSKAVVVGQTIWSPNMPANKRAIVITAGTTNFVEPSNWNGDTVVDGNVTYAMHEYICTGDVSLLGAYPIGYIMITDDGKNPAEIFGGEWRLLQEGFVLISAGTKYTAGNEYGADTVTLAVSEIPSHNHGGSVANGGTHSHSASSNNTGVHIHTTQTQYSNPVYVRGNNSNIGSAVYTTSSAGAHSHTITVATSSSHSHTFTGANVGGGQAHNNMQPWRAVYMWERIA